MPVVIRLETGDIHVVKRGQRVVIGRDSGVEITLKHPRISRDHAEVRFSDKIWIFRDLGSANGSFQGKRRVEHITISAEHEIHLGGPDGPKVWLTHMADDEPEDDGPGTGDGKLETPGHIPLPRRLEVGRSQANDVVVAAEGVADFELAITQTPRGGHDLVVPGDSQATLLNGKAVGKRTPLNPGDVLVVGPWSMRYSGTALEPLEARGGYPFTVDHLSVFAGEKTLLEDVSFQLKPRTVTAVVGPSGAGKSTLLAAMTGRREADRGNVWVGNFDLYERYDELRTRIGLVPQSDLLHTTLGTRQALEYAAALRFPRGSNPDTRSRRVEEVMETLGLSAQADLQISKLSGGQRKRASVALELLTEPDLLFLDEPTSGLDPGLDRQVMNELRQLANGGRTVVVVTHSVANLDVCDEVIVLAPGGRVAFHGSPHNVLQHFGARDWAEVFDELQSSGLKQASESHSFDIDIDEGRRAQIPPHTPPNLITQFGIQARRYLSVIASDRYFLSLLLLLPFVLAGVGSAVGTEFGLGEGPDDEGGLNFQARPLLLVLILGASFMGLSSSIQELVKERPIYEREQSIGLNTSAYLASKVVVLGALVAAQISVFVVITLGGRDVPESGLLLNSAFAEVLLVSVVLGWISMIVGLLISSLVNTSEVTMPALVLVTMSQVVLSGAVPIRYGELLDVIGTVNPGYWAMSWLGALTDLNELAALDEDDQGTFWAFSESNAETSALFLAGLGLVTLVVARVLLRVRNR